jgi:hypothetical protein
MITPTCGDCVDVRVADSTNEDRTAISPRCHADEHIWAQAVRSQGVRGAIRCKSTVVNALTATGTS